jgi:hypothetical protein
MTDTFMAKYLVSDTSLKELDGYNTVPMAGKVKVPEGVLDPMELLR